MKKLIIDLESFKRGCGLTTEILFIILIISVITSCIGITITTSIIIYLIRDFENYILYEILKDNDINHFNI